MKIERRSVKFKELLEKDMKAKEIYDKAVLTGSPKNKNSYYYSEDFLNQSLSEKDMGWCLTSILFLEEGFKKLDKEEPYIINDKLKVSDEPFFSIDGRYGEKIELYNREKEQLIVSVRVYEEIDKYIYKVEKEDLEKLKNIIFDNIWDFDDMNFKDDKYDEIKSICLKFNQYSKYIFISGIYNDQEYGEEEFKLIKYLKDIQSILNKYDDRLLHIEKVD